MQMQVCEAAREVIVAAHLARSRGEGEALDGHLLLTQLKAAAALGIAEGRLSVTDEDWELADVLVRWSTSCRAAVQQSLARARQRSNLAQAMDEADRAEVVEERAIAAQQKRVVRSVLRRLAGGEWLPRHKLRGDLAGRDRQAFDPAVALLIQTGQVVQEGDGYGTRYRLA
jgi:hypothetical protein